MRSVSFVQTATLNGEEVILLPQTSVELIATPTGESLLERIEQLEAAVASLTTRVRNAEDKANEALTLISEAAGKADRAYRRMLEMVERVDTISMDLANTTSIATRTDASCRDLLLRVTQIESELANIS